MLNERVCVNRICGLEPLCYYSLMIVYIVIWCCVSLAVADVCVSGVEEPVWASDWIITCTHASSRRSSPKVATICVAVICLSSKRRQNTTKYMDSVTSGSCYMTSCGGCHSLTGLSVLDGALSFTCDVIYGGCCFFN